MIWACPFNVFILEMSYIRLWYISSDKLCLLVCSHGTPGQLEYRNWAEEPYPIQMKMSLQGYSQQIPTTSGNKKHPFERFDFSNVLFWAKIPINCSPLQQTLCPWVSVQQIVDRGATKMLSIQKDQSIAVTHWVLKADSMFNNVSLNPSSLYLKWVY